MDKFLRRSQVSTNSSVNAFAAELNIPVETLIEQLQAAGVAKSSGSDNISANDKEKLLATLRKTHNSGQKPSVRKIIYFCHVDFRGSTVCAVKVIVFASLLNYA